MSESAAKNEIVAIDSVQEEFEKVEQELQEELTNTGGNPDSMSNAIMHFVMEEKYGRAIRELRGYQKYKEGYPQYKERTDRLFDHIENVIEAIKAKKGLTRAGNVSASRRKEIATVVISHYKQLKGALQRVVYIELQLRMKDSRSTVWVIQALLVGLVLITGVAIVSEAYDSMYGPFDFLMKELENLLARYIGL
jgi:hypothetical protein